MGTPRKEIACNVAGQIAGNVNDRQSSKLNGRPERGPLMVRLEEARSVDGAIAIDADRRGRWPARSLLERSPPTGARHRGGMAAVISVSEGVEKGGRARVIRGREKRAKRIPRGCLGRSGLVTRQGKAERFYFSNRGTVKGRQRLRSGVGGERGRKKEGGVGGNATRSEGNTGRQGRP